MRKISCLFLLFVVLLVLSAEGRRGRSRGGSSSRNSGSGGGGSRSTTQWQLDYQEYVPIALGGAGGITLLTILFCCICNRKCRTCKCCCHSFGQIEDRLVKIDKNCMTQAQFSVQRALVTNLINKVDSEKDFFFTNNGSRVEVKNAKVLFTKHTEFNSEITVTGVDQLGTWSAMGNIIPKEGRIYMWFYKEYSDKTVAGQVNQKEHIVYEMTSFDVNLGIRGRWYYEGMQNEGGEWFVHSTPMGNAPMPGLPIGIPMGVPVAAPYMNQPQPYVDPPYGQIYPPVSNGDPYGQTINYMNSRELTQEDLKINY